MGPQLLRGAPEQAQIDCGVAQIAQAGTEVQRNLLAAAVHPAGDEVKDSQMIVYA
jgi:hypothetical protein